MQAASTDADVFHRKATRAFSYGVDSAYLITSYCLSIPIKAQREKVVYSLNRCIRAWL